MQPALPFSAVVLWCGTLTVGLGSESGLGLDCYGHFDCKLNPDPNHHPNPNPTSSPYLSTASASRPMSERVYLHATAR